MSETPAGWYPAQHANNEMRYWDGTRWQETPPLSTNAPMGESPYSHSQAPTDAATAVYPQTLTAPPAAPSTDVPPAQKRPVLLAASALGVGIAAFVSGLVPWMGLLLGIAAIVLGLFALSRKQSKPMAITGMALGAPALVTGLVVTIGFMALMSSGSGVSTVSTTPSAAATEEAVEPTEEAAPVVEEEPAEPAAAPVEEAPAEPVAPAADGSAERPYPQPYVATGIFGGEKYSLTGRLVDANAGGLVNDWNSFNSAAPAGFKYVVVELTMTGIDPDGVDPNLAEWDLSLATGEGNQYDSEYVVFGEGMPSMWEGPTLYPGSSFTGYAAYVVPEAAQTFMLHDNGNYISF